MNHKQEAFNKKYPIASKDFVRNLRFYNSRVQSKMLEIPLAQVVDNRTWFKKRKTYLL